MRRVTSRGVRRGRSPNELLGYERRGGRREEGETSWVFQKEAGAIRVAEVRR